MKEKLVIYITVLCAFGLLNSYCHTGNETESINIKSFSREKQDLNHLLNPFGTITHAVKLELKNDESIIGNIDQVCIAKNSDIYVGDFDSGKSVMRFNSQGHFLNRFGRLGQGPGEFSQIRRFTIDSNGNAFLLTPEKIIKYSPTGTLLKEKRIDFFGHDIIAIENMIYVAVVKYRVSSPDPKAALLIFDSQLEKTGGILNHDPRLEKYSFLPINLLAKKKENLYFSYIYDLGILQYNTKTRKITRFTIPNQNHILEKTWEKRNFQEEDRRLISNTLHRFAKIHGTNDFLFLYEFCNERRIYDYWILDLEKNKITIFPFPGPGFFETHLFFDRIVGSYEEGILGVFDDPGKFNQYQGSFPALKEISFSQQDNPILVFLGIKRGD